MPDNSTATGCMPCAQRTKIALTEAERTKKPVNYNDLPPVKTCVTWVYSIIGGIPVSYPVCMEHLVIAPAGLAKLELPG